MMNSNEIRSAFLEFFRSKQHEIVPSAQMVVKNDPTLMFTNAGMNQFKDIFLGNSPIKFPRVANTQKCLRVSGKHNDLEEVGHDTYHHTMFEMLGNWSFGDYFKKEAIGWAWEFLTEVIKLEKNRLYVTVFEGSKDDKLEKDSEAFDIWKLYIPEDRIILGSKKDNFWEMGDTGPCGPCSEIHIDLRSEEEIKKLSGKELVNKSHHLVIEIWNNVFIQYNRKSNGQLENLPSKHIDTGMGFERLCMAIQGKQSNYDTDVFQPIIKEVARISGRNYGENKEADIAMRVVADHLRAIAFAIADGQLPSNNKAGYVIRRILRRAVRYGFTFLDLKEPFITRLVPVLAETMGNAFPELKSQQVIIETVIKEEELSFLRTLETGIRLLDQIVKKAKSQKLNVIDGKTAFELYDTFGFPLDLTELILKEKDMTVDLKEFESEMDAQKKRSRVDAVVDSGDWAQLSDSDTVEFVGYDKLEAEVKIIKYRKVNTKGKDFYQLVFNVTPFYAESGGQVGDTGYIEADGEKISIIETRKENNLPIHLSEKLPSNTSVVFKAVVTESKRRQTENNHSATHLLHHALRKVLGNHVEQKGSLVNSEYLRFDFSHFQKVTDEQLLEVSKIVNAKIRENIPLDEKRGVPMKEAVKMGAMALFGEKYGDSVRVVKFGDSVELCGGTHVKATGQIGYFRIISETAIAAGIRRIEAVTGVKAEEVINNQDTLLKEISDLMKNPQNIKRSIENLITENTLLSKQIEGFIKEKVGILKNELAGEVKNINGINCLTKVVEVDSAATLKELSFQLKTKFDNLFLVIGANISGKVNITVMISENLIKDKGLHAGNIVKELALEIGGSGGGQPFFATAGGNKPEGLRKAVEKALVVAGITGQ